MSSMYEKLSGNKAKLSFTIAADVFEEAVRKSFLKNRGRLNVPGFRKGKAPRHLIESLYGATIFYDDAFDSLVPDLYREAVKEHGLHPVDRPEIDVDEIGPGKDLKFHLEVFVRPDVTLGEYKGLSVEVPFAKVTDEMIDNRIKQDQEKASRIQDVEDRPIQNGDTVNLDYAGTVDGVAFEGGTAEGQTLVIGSNQFIPGFEEQMIGMTLGEEKDLNVTFPEQYHAENLAGKDAVFHVKVNGIQETEMPELDDDFAADISEFDTFAEYRESIVKELTEQAEKTNDVRVENALIEKAVENAQMDVPHAMIEDQAEQMYRNQELQFLYQGFRMEDYLKYTGMTKEQVMQSFYPEAEKQVKIGLVLEAIVKAEGIEPSEEQIEAEIIEQAERAGQETEQFKASLTDEQKDYLKDNAAIKVALEIMKKDAAITEKVPEKTEEAE